jgi:CRP-like cAMP-binding protein
MSNTGEGQAARNIEGDTRMETIMALDLCYILANHPLLKGLNPVHLQFMAEYSTELYFEAGQSILREGEAAGSLYLIDRGKVALGVVIPNQGFTTLEVFEEGETLGWSWFIPPYHWHFTALAILPAWVIAIDGKQLRERCEADHDFGYELVKRLALLLGQRLRRSRMQLV